MSGTVCPTLPCPYCVLQLPHTSTWVQVQQRWESIESQAEEAEPSTFKFLMQRVAFEWLSQHLRGGDRLARLDLSTAVAATPEGTSSSRLTPSRNKSRVSHEQARSSSDLALPMQPLPLPSPSPSTGEASAPGTTAEGERFSGLPDTTREADWPQFFWDNSSQTARRRKWVRYDPMPEQAIRQAYFWGHSSVNIAVETLEQGQVWVYHYTIDLTPNAMTQTSEDTGYVRKVQVRENPTEHGV